MSAKRALGECNGAWDACAPAPAPGKRAKPHEPTGVQCSGMKKAEVLDHVDGSVHMQQVLSVQVGGQTKLFGQNGLLLEPWRREGDRTIYRSMSLSFDECSVNSLSREKGALLPTGEGGICDTDEHGPAPRYKST